MQRRRPAPADVNRVLLLGGTSEIGLEILAALGLPRGAEVLLAGRDEQRLAAAGKAAQPARCGRCTTTPPRWTPTRR